MNKEKIEEILLKHSPYVFFGNAVKTELFGETVKHLTTLIQEERKEAVEGFVKAFKEYESKYEIYSSIDDNFVETYLQSLDKGDTDDR